jgi:alpha(1,3/1,4) fucosyltransferase
MKKQLKIAYKNFYKGFDPTRMPQDYFFEFVMSHGYDVIVDEETPDIVFYSVFSSPPSRSDYKNDPLFVASSFEPYEAAGDFDFCFGYGKNAYRFPLWLTYIVWDITNLDTVYKIKDHPNLGQGCHHTPGYFVNGNNGGRNNPLLISNIFTRQDRPIPPKSKFCNFTYNNPVESRIACFNHLSKYKKVDSTGGLLNNTGYKMISKTLELPDYKFTIAFENSYMPGYVTEKLLEPLVAGSLPIYLGDDSCTKDFNKNSFIYALNFNNYENLVKFVKSVDEDQDKYEAYLRAPVFADNDAVMNKPKELFDKIYSKLIDKHPRLA